MLDKSGFESVKQACSRTIQTSGADLSCARGASPSMRERRINGTHDALCERQVASSWAAATLQEAQFKQCDILRSAFHQFFKTTLDIGIRA